MRILFLIITLVASINNFANTENNMSKPSIIFLHGGPGFRDYLKPFLINLEDQFDCVFYDQKRGPDVKIEDLLHELNDIVKEQKTKPILLGHSWGGVLATEYAKNNQSKLKGLILMSTGLSAAQWVQYRDELEELGLADAPPEKIFLTPIELKNGIKLLDKTWESFSGETFDSIFKSYLKKYNLLTALPNIKIPILNIFGEKDLRFSQAVTRSFKRHNQTIKDFEIKDAGHFPFLEENNRKEIIYLIKKNLN